MITIKDKSPDIWAWSDLRDDNVVHYEDGTTDTLTTDKLLFTRGKYAGRELSQVDDEGYLRWCVKSGVDNSDDFLVFCAKLRLLELT